MPYRYTCWETSTEAGHEIGDRRAGYLETRQSGSEGGQRKSNSLGKLACGLPYGNIVRKVAPDAFGLRAVEDGKGTMASLVVYPVVRPERPVIFCSVQTEPHSGKVSKAAPYLDPKGKSGQ